MSCASSRQGKSYSDDCLNSARGSGGVWNQGASDMVTSLLPTLATDIKGLVQEVAAMRVSMGKIESLSRMNTNADGVKQIEVTLKALTTAIDKHNSLANTANTASTAGLESQLRKVEQVFTDLHVTKQQVTITSNEPDVPMEGRGSQEIRSTNMRLGSAGPNALMRDDLKDELKQFHESLMEELRKQPLECNVRALDDKLKESSDAVVRQLGGRFQVDVDAVPSKPALISPEAPTEQPASMGQPSYEEKKMYMGNISIGEPMSKEMIDAHKEFALEFESSPDDAKIELLEDQSFASIFTLNDNLLKPSYTVENYYSKTGIFQEICSSHLFGDITTFVVFVNAIWIGIEEEFNHVENIYDAEIWCQIGTQFFVFYFTIELAIRFMAFEHKCDCWRDGWFRFDAFLVATMVLDTWCFMLITKLVSTGKNPISFPTQPFRVLRLLKLTRMARLGKAVPELLTMVHGLIRSLRAIFSTILLVLVVDYIWALLLHMLMKDEKVFNDKIYEQSFLDFKSLGRCMWILIMNGTLLLDNSAPLMTQMLWSNHFNVFIAGILFFIFVFLTAILILQMLIGVLCDLVSTLNGEQLEAQAIGLVKQELLVKITELDVDKSGSVTKDEFLSLISMSSSRAILSKLGINEMFLLQMIEMLYSRDPQQKIKIAPALQLILLCREDQKTTIKTLASGIGYVVREIHHLREETLHHMRQPMLHQVPYSESEIPPAVTPRTGQDGQEIRQRKSKDKA